MTSVSITEIKVPVDLETLAKLSGFSVAWLYSHIEEISEARWPACRPASVVNIHDRRVARAALKGAHEKQERLALFYQMVFLTKLEIDFKRIFVYLHLLKRCALREVPCWLSIEEIDNLLLFSLRQAGRICPAE